MQIDRASYHAFWQFQALKSTQYCVPQLPRQFGAGLEYSLQRGAEACGKA